MKFSDEARVGLLVTISFTIFIVLIGLLAKINVSQSGYRLRIYFGFLNDLREGAPVKIAGGIKIGQVDLVEIVQGDFHRFETIAGNEPGLKIHCADVLNQIFSPGTRS